MQQYEQMANDYARKKFGNAGVLPARLVEVSVGRVQLQINSSPPSA